MKISILKQKNFSVLMIGKLFSLIGTGMQSFALSLYVLKITGSATKFATSLAISIIPQLILGPIAGVIADWFNRKRLIIYLDLLSGFIVMIFAYMYNLNGKLSLVNIYILVIIVSMISAIYNPSINTIIPTIIEKKDLLEANSVNTFIMNIGNILSPLIAGALFGIYGMSIILFINAMSFILSAVCELFLSIPQTNIKPEKITIISFYNNLLKGFKFIKEKKIILNIIILGLIVNFAFSPIFSVGLTYISKQILKISDYQYGIFQSICVLAAIIAPFAISLIYKKLELGKILFLDILTTSILITIMILPLYLHLFWGNFKSYIILMILAFLIQLITGVGNIALSTIIQKETPIYLMGRVNAAFSMGVMSAVPLGQMVFGILFDKIPVWICLSISSLILFIAILSLKKGLVNNQKYTSLDAAKSILSDL